MQGLNSSWRCEDDWCIAIYVEHCAMMQLDIYGAATHLSVSGELAVKVFGSLYDTLRWSEGWLAGTQINERMISTEHCKCSTEVYCHPLVVRLLCIKCSGVYLWLLEWRDLWCSGSDSLGAIICNWCTVILLMKRLDSCDKNQWWSNECWKWIIKILCMSSLH